MCEKGTSELQRSIPSYPNAIRAQLQHLQEAEVLQVGNAGDFVVNQKQFFQLSQSLQILNLPQNVERHIKLPVGSFKKVSSELNE